MLLSSLRATFSAVLVTLFVIIYSLGTAQAESIRPFQVSNQSPFLDVLSLPFTPDAQLLKPKQQQVSFDVAWASHSFRQDSDTEALLIDGESVQLNLMWRMGVGRGDTPDFELGILVPLRHQGGGIMDSGITEFHSTFGLPHGERKKTPNNQINYRYGKGQNGQIEALVDVSPSGSSLGDIRCFVAKQWRVRSKSGYNLAWQNELKIPTGRLADWTGNDALAISSSLAYDAAFYESEAINWQSFSHVGIRFSEKGKVLPDQQKQFGVFGGFGLMMQWRSLQLQTQMDAHTATYESTLNAFGPSVQITFGANYITDIGLFSFSIGEDIFPETAPDVVFKLAWRSGR